MKSFEDVLELAGHRPDHPVKMTIRKQWFQAILTGVKTSEYRVNTPFWLPRLGGLPGRIEHGDSVAVVLVNGGYISPGLPWAAVEVPFMRLALGHMMPENPLGWACTEEVWEIRLGRILARRNA